MSSGASSYSAGLMSSPPSPICSLRAAHHPFPPTGSGLRSGSGRCCRSGAHGASRRVLCRVRATGQTFQNTAQVRLTPGALTAPSSPGTGSLKLRQVKSSAQGHVAGWESWSLFSVACSSLARIWHGFILPGSVSSVQ